MGLDNFDIAPDNRGGRKEEQKDEYGREIQGAFTGDNDTEDFWENQYRKVVGLGDLEDSHIVELCNSLHLLPRTVKQKLTEHDVYEFEDYVARQQSKQAEKSTSLQALVDNAKQ